MAKGNDGNYLQHCIEVEAAVRLARTAPERRLHVALTHGMAPFEQVGEPKRNAHRLLYDALRAAAGEPRCNEREIVKAYRASWKRQAYRPDHTDLFEKLKREKHYPNTAELLRTVIGTDRLSGGITEKCAEIHEALVQAWSGSGVVVGHSSWRKRLGAGSALGCPDGLDAPWLFSMDPMTYAEDGDKDDANLNRSDLGLLEPALGKYFDSGQPGIACFFVYKMGAQNKSSHQRQFWAFVDKLVARLEVQTCSYWVAHQCGSLNLAGLLFSDKELALGFVPPGINRVGRGRIVATVRGCWNLQTGLLRASV